MRLTVTASLLATCLILSAGCASQTKPLTPLAPAPSAPAPSVALSGEPAPLPNLVGNVAIPYEKFTLDNGLTVLVNEVFIKLKPGNRGALRATKHKMLCRIFLSTTLQ